MKMLMELLVLLFSLLSATWFWAVRCRLIVWLHFFHVGRVPIQYDGRGCANSERGSRTVPMVVFAVEHEVVLDAPAFASPWFLIVAVMGNLRALCA